ncbi:sensor histidine kinase [Phytoactinopolyspora halophila]|nr:histidine kinase [Phytoactinopolyspora halophila]
MMAMTGLVARWHERGSAERVDLYTRLSLYALYALELPLALMIVNAADRADDAAAITFACLAGAQAVTGVVVLRRGLGWFLGTRTWPVRMVAVSGILAVAGALAGIIAFPFTAGGADNPGQGDALALVTIFFLVMLTPRLSMRWLLLPTGALAAVVGVAMLLTGSPVRAAAGVALACVIGGIAGGFGFRTSIWILGIVWELERSRGAQARLAVAEERLRIARDLHDVIGRNLAVIALKSELGAQLARRGRDEAADEMLEVHRIAQESLREVREVVRGYRSADLPAELDGARAVLRSAGVRTRVLGDGADLPAGAQAALAWVVREGTTNILRHSDASECTITVDIDDPAGSAESRARDAGDASDAGANTGAPAGTAIVTMENDGVAAWHSEAVADLGSGLRGLAERLGEVNGSLEARRVSGDRFVLRARVPREVRPISGGESSVHGGGSGVEGMDAG